MRSGFLENNAPSSRDAAGADHLFSRLAPGHRTEAPIGKPSISGVAAPVVQLLVAVDVAQGVGAKLRRSFA